MPTQAFLVWWLHVTKDLTTVCVSHCNNDALSHAVTLKCTYRPVSAIYGCFHIIVGLLHHTNSLFTLAI